MIEEKNEELEEKVFERTRELREINKDMVDSINYAKRLQDSILPSHNAIVGSLENYFLMFKPRDIVSGDFYWYHHVKDANRDLTIFAVVDCTGHGVPGAMMSVIGNSSLNKIVKEEGVFESDKILNRLHEEVYRSLNSDKS